jgi:hypothetical protein
MNNITLKACPFCDGKIKKNTEQLSELYSYANRVVYSCQSCGCSRGATGDTSKRGYADNSTTDARALKSWNTRYEEKGSEL